MPDKRSRRKAAQRDKFIDNPRRIRLYADEDVDDAAVEQLRRDGVNVMTAAEAGNQGRDDQFQAAFAKRKRRIILTRNAKHFLNDRLLPFESTRGVIALDAHPANRDAYLTALALVSHFLVPYAETYERMKIKVSIDGITFRYIDLQGKLVNERLSVEDLIEGRYPEDDEEP